MNNLSQIRRIIFLLKIKISQLASGLNTEKKLSILFHLCVNLTVWALVKIYTDFLGKENTNVLVYEELKKIQEITLKKLYKILGININEINNLKLNSVNKKVYKDRLFIENIKRKFPNSEYLKKLIPPPIIRFFMNKIFNDHKNKLKKNKLIGLINFAKNGNREINRNFKLKLKNYNYSL